MDALVLYGAIFLSGLFALAAVLGVYLVRTESRDAPTVDPGAVLEATDGAVAVVDADDTVVLADVAFRSLFGADPTGRKLDDVLADHPDVLAATTDDADGTISLGTDGERPVEVYAHPIGEGVDADRKRLVCVRDVTDRGPAGGGEHLETIASRLSHDLRNPLDVAIGRTNAAAEATSNPEVETHLATARDAHDRMQRIVSDVLTLARYEERVQTVSDVPLRSVAQDAWRHVDTGTASLTVETEAAVRADRDGLVRTLENLFRNAVEHGPGTGDGPDHDAATPGEGITVRVGASDGGFYVTDDGVGLPTDQHEAVFESGHTGDGTGTGLGLAIVDRIATAHGWEVRLLDGDSGGVRVEFSGVDVRAGDTTGPDRP